MYWPCVFNFPSLVHCKTVTSTFWTMWPGKCWSNWVGTYQMDPKCPNLVGGGHVTWHIVWNIQNKWLRHTLIPFCWKIQNDLDDQHSGTLWSHDLVHFEHPCQYPKLGHGGYICLVYFEISKHILVWDSSGSLAPELIMYLQCTGSVHHPLPPVLASQFATLTARVLTLRSVRVFI